MFKGSKAKIVEKVQEWGVDKLLPIGVDEFHKWADNIIDAAGLPAKRDDQKFVLANMLVHDLSPTDHKKADGFFIAKLRKIAANQVALEVAKQIKEARDQAATNEPV